MMLRVQSLSQGHLVLVSGLLAVSESSYLPGFAASPRPLSTLLIFRCTNRGRVVLGEELLFLYVGDKGTGAGRRKLNSTPGFKD